jgi:purine-binding chemotaxis protein CheW
MPETPAHVLGVLNLRGTIVPVVDLRARFGLPDNGTAAGRVIIVLAVPVEGREHEFGLVVDAVSEVLDLDEATLKALPELGEVRSGCITALMEHGDSLVMLLDASRLLSASETQVH